MYWNTHLCKIKFAYLIVELQYWKQNQQIFSDQFHQAKNTNSKINFYTWGDNLFDFQTYCYVYGRLISNASWNKIHSY